ncbi:hypothetical protein JTE90_020368 [Oedothorax gibbosus]|uniref:Peptidase aspartic putative domain-containing protein n=1 Tax=Oedothorax gibbosus TaxID=931172 RepID=A0AAV6TXG5_9ARAC|nr:hypothetical protein JTE90_020368 [Oedothorax gibbosus]
MIKVIDRHGNETIARALVDQGSQSSFVLESLTQRLNFKTKSTRALITEIGSSGEYCRKNPYFSKPGKIEVLLGADIFPYILTDGLVKGPPSTPMAQNTLLGWILVGPVTCQTENAADSTIQLTNLHSSSLDLSDQIKRFWELEEVQARTRSLPEDEQCETFYKETITRQDRSYTVQFPFKVPQPALGETENTALTCFTRLERRLDKNTELAERYYQHMQEYIDLKNMTEVPYSQQQLMLQDIGYPGFNLPHHPVFKKAPQLAYEWSTMPLKETQTEFLLMTYFLLTVPNIQEKMANILLRWRLYKVEFTADITKMYRMINVAENHQDYQRIIWRDNNSQPIKHYRLTTATIGMEPSAFLAIRTLKHIKTLGLLWKPTTDTLNYKANISLTTTALTKRTVLSDISKFYDPFGWISPILVTGKILMQRLWLTHKVMVETLNWDEELPAEIHQEWIKITNNQQEIDQISIPRWAGYTSRDNLEFQLHGFCDTSTKAYSALVFIKITNTSTTLILVAKTRIAPLKQISLQKLELCGAHLLSKLILQLFEGRLV